MAMVSKMGFAFVHCPIDLSLAFVNIYITISQIGLVL